jgi:hypothetical protein
MLLLLLLLLLLVAQRRELGRTSRPAEVQFRRLLSGRVTEPLVHFGTSLIATTQCQRERSMAIDFRWLFTETSAVASP